jgi:hypothetical protein
MAARISRAVSSGTRPPKGCRRLVVRLGIVSLGALSVAACGARGSLPVIGESSATDAPQETLPAFVVYTRSLQTFLVPIDKNERAVVSNGVWLLGGDRIARVASIARAQDIPTGILCAPQQNRAVGRVCDLPDLEDGDSELLATVEGLPGRPALETKEGDCTCYEDVGPRGKPAPEPRADSAPGAAPAGARGADGDGDGDGDRGRPIASDAPPPEGCEDSFDDRGIVSIVGGALYSIGVSDNGGCSGPRAMFVDVDVSDPLHESKPRPVAGAPRCLQGLPNEDFSTRFTAEACTEGTCCDSQPSTVPVYSEDSEQLAAYDFHAEDPTTFATRVTVLPLSPATCPGPFDPCGTAAAFPEKVRTEKSWVATDESAALVVEPGRVLVFRKGSPSEVRSEKVPVPTAIIGVRYHADASALRDRLAGEAALTKN